MNYTIVQVGEGTGGGMMACPGPDVSPQWLPYIQAKDVAETFSRGRALGATLMKEVTEVPGMGWFGVLNDRGGATIALWQPMMWATARHAFVESRPEKASRSLRRPF